MQEIAAELGEITSAAAETFRYHPGETRTNKGS